MYRFSRFHLSMSTFVRAGLLALFAATLALCAAAQEKPYFVTYSHDLEEPGNLEVETKTAIGKPADGNRFGALATEFEYGVNAWWTSELYLDGQATAKESTIFTGFRLENRFRPLMRDHFINPALYVEFEDINGADKNILEVVGHDGSADLSEATADTRQEKQRELETKLILSSNVHDWNISENFIAEKNLVHAPWEFGYAVAVARPLRSAFSGRECVFCAEKFIVGAEAYGGLGDVWDLSLHDTSHYIAPMISWDLPGKMRVKFEPGFGLTDSSLDRVYRAGVSYEFKGFARMFRGEAGGVR